MFTPFELILFPLKAWQKIAERPRGVLWVISLFLIPWILVSVGAEAFSLTRWGHSSSKVAQKIYFSQDQAVHYAGAQVLLLLGSIVLSAVSIYSVAQSFQVRCTFAQCFVLTAYSYAPIILAHLLSAAPFLPSWVCWGIGVLISFSILYHGIGLYLKPDQTKGFGLYLFSCIVVLVSSGLAQAVAVAIVDGKIKLPLPAL